MHQPQIVLLHGVTMNGTSIVRTLGPIVPALEQAGFELVAPNAPFVMRPDALDSLLKFLKSRWAEHGQDPAATFQEGLFWADGDHRDWFDSRTEPDGRRIYDGLDQSLQAIEDAVAAERVVGLIGFSQGGAMGAVVTALALRGEGPLAGRLRFSCLLNTFLPKFDEPALGLWPTQGGCRVLLTAGGRDPLFTGAASLRDLEQAFAACEPESRVFPELAHDVLRTEDFAAELVALATSVAPLRRD